MNLERTSNLNKTFFALFLPLVLQNIVTTSVNLADNVMLGIYSESALMGVTAVNNIQFIFQQIILSLGDGVVIFASRLWSEKKYDEIRSFAFIGTATAVLISSLMFVLMRTWPAQILSLFSNDRELQQCGMEYLRTVNYSYLLFGLTQLLLAMMRSTGTVRIAFRLSLLSLVLNCVINYLLIFGNCGMPELGVTGAAIGTLISRAVECAVAIIYVFRLQTVLPGRARSELVLNRDRLSTYYKKTIPITIISSLWGANLAVQSIILGQLSTSAFAANSAVSVVYQLVKSAAVGSGSAAAVMIGMSIGKGCVTEVKNCSLFLQKRFCQIGIISGIILFLLRIPILKIYQLTPEALTLANNFLIILSVTCATMNYQMPTNSGIIKGAGDVRYAVRLDLISIWCIVLPISYLAAFVFKAPAEIIILLLNSDQIFKGIPAYIRTHNDRWYQRIMNLGN